ncbi:MAG: type II toxin-antitoxin system RelE/ParE family toxin [Bosea sp. (in: a-proteobacteria)]|uniref:type II toxin-antitoxin system RelE/ParE family toxin n=1 Tax=Bosea sp. (in: a-proteobacteria) TaxID=1871050 RepID=UPI002732AF1F|nr:type II toxin-antitoxin system RelE/ParE family toxin [Bosea sp. (in: a-proteobacteria)]MDP3254588.1 type II toxin-antitoxin system RelE/ParE family toxin [Bosea sp. (in: a-proteobacteria)]MDP3317790.1 type II toxin-antitoxin system RelE/ParE family toxin [Bosea sp. (in: a-proteobacteria)]
MTRFELKLSPQAEFDLRSIYDWIAKRSSPQTADRYIQRIETTYRSLADFPMRGTLHDDLLPGLRIIGMERRVTIAFRIIGDRVEILRILYGGRDVKAALET